MTLLRASLILAVLAGLGLAALPLLQAAPVPAGARSETVSPAGSALPGALPPLESLSETRTRPPFLVARRPEPTGARLGAHEAVRPLIAERFAPMGAIALSGTPLVLLKDVRTGEIQRFRVGERIGDWDVVAISLDALVIRRGEDEQTVRFETNPTND